MLFVVQLEINAVSGHTVTALVRNPNSLQSQIGLVVVKGIEAFSKILGGITDRLGSPLNQPDVYAAFNSTPNDPPNAVIVTLASVRASDNPFSAVVSPPRMMADSNTNILVAMRAHDVRKLVIMAALGVGDSFQNLSFPLRWLFRKSNIAASFADHDAVDRIVKQSGIDFVLVRPARLTDGEAEPVKEYGDQGKGIGFMSAISRKSVAQFLVTASEASTWVRKTPVIAN